MNEKLNDSEIRDLYRELILDHAKGPRRIGFLPGATHSAKGINPVCGDSLSLYLKLDHDAIVDLRFDGQGCAISVASASLMGDDVIGMTTDSALSRIEQVNAELCGNGRGADLGKLEALKGVRDYPSRVKCATLAWHALRTAICSPGDAVRTE